jgi:integrase
MPGKPNRRGFGYIRKLPSGRYHASITGPDTRRHNAPSTFQSKQDAEGWLAAEHKLISAGTWIPPVGREDAHRTQLTFGTYSEAWLRDRDLKPRTRQHYRSLLDRQILPTFEHVPLATITPESVRAWHALLGTSRPTLRAHGYGLLRSILGTAEHDRLITSNPAHIRGAGGSRRVHKVEPLSLAELETLVAAMPQRHQVMTLLASWCAMRFGELAELRRKDIDLANGVIRVRRAVVRADGQTIVSTPKSDAGTRNIAIPPHLLPMLRTHITEHMAFGKDALLFPAADGVSHLSPSTLYGRAPTSTSPGWGFYAAREAAGRPAMRWHDLRHCGSVYAAAAGASLGELMGRLGHSTSGAALRYMHVAQGRDHEIAAALSRLAEANPPG